jgi:hypothetical protein
LIDKLEMFRKWDIKDVQKIFFLKHLPKCGGRFRYPSTGLSSPTGTLVLFQYKARIVASARLLRDERFKKPIGGSSGAFWFDVASIRTFDPLDIDAMRKVWPGMRRFGHIKQVLNPTKYAMFRRKLKNVTAPEIR